MQELSQIKTCEKNDNFIYRIILYNNKLAMCESDAVYGKMTAFLVTTGKNLRWVSFSKLCFEVYRISNRLIFEIILFLVATENICIFMFTYFLVLWDCALDNTYIFMRKKKYLAIFPPSWSKMLWDSMRMSVPSKTKLLEINRLVKNTLYQMRPKMTDKDNRSLAGKWHGSKPNHTC